MWCHSPSSSALGGAGGAFSLLCRGLQPSGRLGRPSVVGSAHGSAVGWRRPPPLALGRCTGGGTRREGRAPPRVAYRAHRASRRLLARARERTDVRARVRARARDAAAIEVEGSSMTRAAAAVSPATTTGTPRYPVTSRHLSSSPPATTRTGTPRCYALPSSMTFPIAIDLPSSRSVKRPSCAERSSRGGAERSGAERSGAAAEERSGRRRRPRWRRVEDESQ